jgi:ABC-type Mn2+/Zn2+ transport system permease subunit
MIRGFLDSWPLFHNAYLAGWLLAAALAVVGVLVVARDQIFIGAAVSQASTLGLAVAMRLGDVFAAAPWLRSDAFLSGLAVAFSAGAALLTARGGGVGRPSHEALTGGVFLFSASVAILVVAHSPHGLEEVHRLVSSSIIGASATDVWVLAVVALATGATFAVAHRRLLLLTLDPAMAAAVGVRVGAWSLLIALWLGLLIGLAIRCAGVLYGFGCLVLPPLVARNVCREVRPMLVVAPLVAVAAALVGFVVADARDLPPAQMTVAILCGLALLTSARRGSRVAASLVLVSLLAACPRPLPVAPPADVRRIAVDAPVFRHGPAPLVAGEWVLERLGGRAPTTAGEILAAEARRRLAEAGYEIVPPGAGPTPKLRLEVERWDPELPQPSFVVVTVSARLVDPTSNGTLWGARRERWMVPTRGAPTVGAAHAAAARTVAAELLAPFRRR